MICTSISIQTQNILMDKVGVGIAQIRLLMHSSEFCRLKSLRSNEQCPFPGSGRRFLSSYGINNLHMASFIKVLISLESQPSRLSHSAPKNKWVEKSKIKQEKEIESSSNHTGQTSQKFSGCLTTQKRRHRGKTGGVPVAQGVPQYGGLHLWRDPCRSGSPTVQRTESLEGSLQLGDPTEWRIASLEATLSGAKEISAPSEIISLGFAQGSLAWTSLQFFNERVDQGLWRQESWGQKVFLELCLVPSKFIKMYRVLQTVCGGNRLQSTES